MPYPLHAAPSAAREAVLVVALPVAGLVQGLVAAAVTLPVAMCRRGWLLQRRADPPGTHVVRHLLVGAGVGAVEAVLTLLVVVALPERLLESLALVRPSLPWAVAFSVGALLIGAAFALAARPAGSGTSPLSRTARTVAGVYLLALVAVGVATVEASTLLA